MKIIIKFTKETARSTEYLLRRRYNSKAKLDKLAKVAILKEAANEAEKGHKEWIKKAKIITEVKKLGWQDGLVDSEIILPISEVMRIAYSSFLSRSKFAILIKSSDIFC